MAPTSQWVRENWRRAVANLVPALGALESSPLQDSMLKSPPEPMKSWPGEPTNRRACGQSARRG